MTEFKIELKYLVKIFNQSEIAEMLGTKQPNVATMLKTKGDRLIVILINDEESTAILALIKKLAKHYKFEEAALSSVREAISSSTSVVMEKLK